MKKRLYMVLISAALVLSLSACGKEKKPSDVAPPETSTETSGDTEGANVISPLPSGIELNKMDGYTVRASFTTDDFNWRGGNLSFTAYDDILYDSADIANIKVGDTLVTDNGETVIETIEKQDSGYIFINSDKDDICIAPNEGGTYYLAHMDDIHGVVEVGTAEVPLADDVKFTDCTSEPGEVVEVPSDDIKIYLDELEDFRATFYYADTTLRVEGGQIVEITRSWRP